MAAITRFGDSLLNPVEQADSPKVEFQADGVAIISRHWVIDNSQAEFFQPLPGELDPSFAYSAKCVSSISELGEGSQAHVRAVFQGYLTLPPTIYEFQNSRLDRPIQMNPNFEDIGDNFKVFSPILDPTTGAPTGNQTFVKFQDASTTEADNKFAGVESYIVGMAQWKKTAYATSPDFSQTDVGKLSAPEIGPWTGNGIPDPANDDKSWLKIDKTCFNLLKGASILWLITETWLYNADGWLEEFYGP